MQVTLEIPKRVVVRERLSNGTTLLFASNPYNSIVGVNIYSKYGSRYDAAGKAGMANLAMRMLSTGTKFHTEEEISLLLEKNGAHFNAEASKDYSNVALMTTTDFLKEDLQTVLELIDHPTFPENKLKREIDIVKMNILEQDDSLLNYTFRIFRKNYFGDNPYAWPNVGLADHLDTIQRDELVQFAQAAFEPDHLVVSVVGGTENSEVHDYIRDIFAERETRSTNSLCEPTMPKPVFSGNHEFIENRESEAEYIVMGYPGCGIKEKASIPLRIISALLGGSMDSRLFREIRDKRGLCYQIGANYTPYYGHSPLMLYTVTTPSNRQEIVACMEAEIRRLHKEYISEEEMNRVKTFLCGTFIMSLETVMGQSARYGMYEIAGLGWNYVNRFTDDIHRTTTKTIIDVAQEYFTNRLLTITTPPQASKS